MCIVDASEAPQAHIRWTWETPESADERTVAAEAVTASFLVSFALIRPEKLPVDCAM